jgi:hypothetical protein
MDYVTATIQGLRHYGLLGKIKSIHKFDKLNQFQRFKIPSNFQVLVDPVAPIWVGHYTETDVNDVDSVTVQGCIPHSPNLVDAKDHHAAMKYSKRLFAESEANCNTCKYFSRVRTDAIKGKSGASTFIYGNCLSPDGLVETHPYFGHSHIEQIVLHPDDPGLMKCWVSRWD